MPLPGHLALRPASRWRLAISTTADGQPDYRTVWTSLPRTERAQLSQAALKGQPSANRWDAALTLWWVQRELRYAIRNSLLIACAMVLVLLLFAWVVDGVPPTSFGNVLRAVPLLPVFLLIPLASTGMRRPRLRIAAQLNAGVLAGKKLEGPPAPEEAERLLARARTQGWFRGSRPKR